MGEGEWDMTLHWPKGKAGRPNKTQVTVQKQADASYAKEPKPSKAAINKVIAGAKVTQHKENIAKGAKGGKAVRNRNNAATAGRVNQKGNPDKNTVNTKNKRKK